MSRVPLQVNNKAEAMEPQSLTNTLWALATLSALPSSDFSDFSDSAPSKAPLAPSEALIRRLQAAAEVKLDLFRPQVWPPLGLHAAFKPLIRHFAQIICKFTVVFGVWFFVTVPQPPYACIEGSVISLDTVEWTVKTSLSHLVTQEFNPPVNYVRGVVS